MTSTTWPSPVASRCAQRDHDCERARERGDLVGERDRREQGRPVGLAVDRGEPAHRLGHRREAGTRRIRAVLAEAGDAEQDQPRIPCEQHVGAEPESFDRARPEVLDQHVGIGGERDQRIATRVGLEVEHDRALVPTEQLPRVRVAAFGWEPPHPAHTVTRRRLDLDHVGTEVREMARRARTREHGRHVDHPQTVERLHDGPRYEIVISLIMPSTACGSSFFVGSGKKQSTTYLPGASDIFWYTV